MVVEKGNGGKKMRDAKVWIRIGDNDDYHDFDSPYDAGYEIGSVFPEAIAASTIRRVHLGIEVIPSFIGYNYISLFWGDDDAQVVNEPALTDGEFDELLQGIDEGMDQ